MMKKTIMTWVLFYYLDETSTVRLSFFLQKGHRKNEEMRVLF